VVVDNLGLLKQGLLLENQELVLLTEASDGLTEGSDGDLTNVVFNEDSNCTRSVDFLVDVLDLVAVALRVGSLEVDGTELLVINRPVALVCVILELLSNETVGETVAHHTVVDTPKHLCRHAAVTLDAANCDGHEDVGVSAVTTLRFGTDQVLGTNGREANNVVVITEGVTTNVIRTSPCNVDVASLADALELCEGKILLELTTRSMSNEVDVTNNTTESKTVRENEVVTINELTSNGVGAEARLAREEAELDAPTLGGLDQATVTASLLVATLTNECELATILLNKPVATLVVVVLTEDDRVNLGAHRDRGRSRELVVSGVLPERAVCTVTELGVEVLLSRRRS